MALQIHSCTVETITCFGSQVDISIIYIYMYIVCECVLLHAVCFSVSTIYHFTQLQPFTLPSLNIVTCTDAESVLFFLFCFVDISFALFRFVFSSQSEEQSKKKKISYNIHIRIPYNCVTKQVNVSGMKSVWRVYFCVHCSAVYPTYTQ